MRRNPASVFVASGLVWQAGIIAYWTSFVVRITIELDLPGLELVLLGTVMELSLLVSEVPTGVLADRLSRKWSVVIGFVFVGGAQIAAGLVSSFPLLLITQMAWGIGYTFRSGADLAWVTDEGGGAERVESLVLRLARWQLLLGVLAIGGGAGLARSTSLATAIVAAGALLVVTGGALAWLMVEHNHPRRSPSTVIGSPAIGPARPGSEPWPVATAWSTFAAGARASFGDRSLRILALVLVLSGLASEAVDRLNVRRLDDLGLSAHHDEVVAVAGLLGAEALLAAGLLWLTRNRFRGPRTPAGTAMLLAPSAVGIAVLALAWSLPAAVVAVVVQGGLRSAAAPLTQIWANSRAPSELRATVLSFTGQATAVGEIVGGVVLGLVAARTTVATALVCSAGLILGAAVVAIRAIGAGGPEPAPMAAPMPTIAPAGAMRPETSPGM